VLIFINANPSLTEVNLHKHNSRQTIWYKSILTKKTQLRFPVTDNETPLPSCVNVNTDFYSILDIFRHALTNQ